MPKAVQKRVREKVPEGVHIIESAVKKVLIKLRLIYTETMQQ